MNAKKFFSNKIIAPLIALLCVTLWGTAFPVIKKCYEIFSIPTSDYPSKVLFAGYRFFIAGVMVLIVAIILQKKFVKPSRKDILPISIMGFLQIFLQYLFSYIGLSNTTGTKTSVITSLGSFIGVLISPIFFTSDKLNVKKILGCIIGFIGVIVINLDGLTTGGFTLLGEGFVVFSTIAATGGNIYCKKISKGRDPMTVSAYHLLIGGGGLIIVGALFGGYLDFSNITIYLLLIYLVIVSAASFTLLTDLLKYNPVSKILIFNLLIPIFGTIWSGILLGEDIINLYNIVSVVLISIGIILVNLRSKKDEN